MTSPRFNSQVFIEHTSQCHALLMLMWKLISALRDTCQWLNVSAVRAVHTFCQGNTEKVPSPEQIGGLRAGPWRLPEEATKVVSWLGTQETLSHKITLKIVVTVPGQIIKETDENVVFFSVRNSKNKTEQYYLKRRWGFRFWGDFLSEFLSAFKSYGIWQRLYCV